MIKVIFDVKLDIKGPILCSAQGDTQYGVDAYFQKDWQGNYFIGKSHIKGKLREAWSQILRFIPDFEFTDIERYLGDIAEEGFNTPRSGLLLFSDFIPCISKDTFMSHSFHRIKIHPESKTVDEGALQTFETPFASGEVYQWRGEILAYIQQSEQKKLENALQIGFKWITAIGANKSIGFGQIESVEIKAKSNPLPAYSASKCDVPTVFGICVYLNEPLMIGGVRSSDILLKSDKVISGAIFKGAIAAAINRRSGNKLNTPVTKKNIEFPTLGKYFDQIRITHGFAARKDILPLKRSVVLPISIVKFDNAYYDALTFDSIPFDKGIPEFAIDWKDDGALDSYFGIQTPRFMLTTRTAIDGNSRRSKEQQLYTFQAVCPEDEKKNSLVWLSNIYLPRFSENEKSEKQKLFTELKFIIENELEFLGKRNSSVGVSISDYPFDFFINQIPEFVDNEYVYLTLQTPALMLEAKRDVAESIGNLYKSYWEDVSDNALTMDVDDFFASQIMLGGHLYFRYMKHAKPDAYYPYYLTDQGSSFKLKVKNGQRDKALDKIKTWMQAGLPAPSWAEKMYSKENTPFSWKTCPFVPQNGFGEIVINHIARFKNNKDGSINFEGEQ